MNVLVLAAGEVPTSGPFAYPLWLAEVEGRLVLDRQIALLSAGDEAKYTYAFRENDIADRHVDRIAEQLTPGARIISIGATTAGAACTALLALAAVDPDEELIIASATDHVEVDFGEMRSSFRSRSADAGIVSFESLHPRYSFVRMDAEGWVVEAAEKNPISRHANAGLYWFARGGDFLDSVKKMILKDGHLGGVFYICPSLNEMVLAGKRVAVGKITPGDYFPLKEAGQLQSLQNELLRRRSDAARQT